MDVKAELKSYEIYLRLGNYQKSTIAMYLKTVENFYKFWELHNSEESPNQEHVQNFLLSRLEGGKSWSTLNVDYSSLRKYFIVIKDYEWSLKKLPRPKKEKRMPKLLSKEDVGRLIEAAPNYKYQVFLTFLYSTGVRLSEATNVKMVDIDSDRMQIRIHRGKGAKDRIVEMPSKLLRVLRSYYKVYRPKEYLFNGRVKGTAYSASAGQWSIRRARSVGKIKKKCSIHTLRNCYATHHLELGTDLVYLQEQMGHKHLKTTAKYIRLCMERYRQINHPIERLQITYRIPTT